MQEMKIKIGNREYTLNNNSGKFDRAKIDAGERATNEQVFAHYDKLAGLIRDENGNKVPNGNFWEGEKKRIEDEILKVTPELYGFCVKLKALWKKVKSWF